MRRVWLVLLVLAVLGGGGGFAWWYYAASRETGELVLYGNVDLRQVQLAFNNSERISEVNFLEGKIVKKGEIMARLDTSRLQPQVDQAEAQMAAQRQVYKRLYTGSRPEEIAQARANLEMAKAELTNSRRQYQRLKSLQVVRLSDKSEVRAVSQEDVDNAKANLDVAEAKLVVQQKALDLSLAGPRVEEVAEAEARLRANEWQLAFLRQQLEDAVLRSPAHAVVRSRLMEPGEMASPIKAVYSLAIIDPKWVRAYISEMDLGKIYEGMPAEIGVDSFPDRRFPGKVGFISSVAEFTPKAVQTEELRTKLVYEVRVNVADPNNELRLGMPATIYFPKASPSK